jgi:DNA ligase-1
MVFELPLATGDFSMRYQQMRQLYKQQGNQSWQIVEQRAAPKTLASLQEMLVNLDTQGGEGFMLKSKTAAYRGGRSDDLLKVKLKNDAEAQVVSHHKGKGRLATVMGSITVQMPNGIQFKIGSGFSDAQRKSPPAVGATVSYKYNGLTKNGKPRFPVFWRIRGDKDL